MGSPVDDDGEAAPDGPSRLARARTRATAVADDGRRRRDAALTGLAHRRHRHPALDVAWRGVDLDARVNGGILSAAVALRLFLFVVPLGLVLVTGFGFLADAGQETPTELARRAGVTGLIASAVGSAGELTVLNRLVLLAGGLYAGGRAARSLRQTLEVVHALVWDQRPEPRGGVRPALGLLAVAAAAAVLVLVVGRIRAADATAGAVATAVSLVVPLGGWWWLSDRLPHGDAPRRALLPGAVLMAAGVQVVHVVTVYLLARQVSGRSDTYGTLAVAMAVLLWATFLGRLVVSTAVLNATVWEGRRQGG